MDKVIAKEIIGVMNDNTTIISELRRVIETQGKKFDEQSAKVIASGICLQEIKKELKDIHTQLSAVDECSGLTETTVIQVKDKLEEIDKWHKIKFPAIIGLITLIIYSIGFFFTLDKIYEKIDNLHITKSVQVENKAIK